MSTLALSIRLAAKRSGWHWKNGQKLKTGRHSNLHHKIRFCSHPMPRAAPPAPPNAHKSCRTDQGPNRDAAAAAGPEQTGLADRAPAARSAAAAGSPQAARWQVRAAVSDPNCSRPAPGRPSGSGSAGAMSRVSRALREQRVEAAWGSTSAARRGLPACPAAFVPS